MRLLSALVLTHCFGCILPVEFQKMHALRSTGNNTSKRNPNTLETNSVDKRTDGNREGNYNLTANLNFMRKYQAHNRRKIKYKYYDLEHSFVFNLKEYRYAQIHGLVPQRYGKGLPMLLVSQKCLRCSENSKHSRRKLLSYLDKDVPKDLVTSGRFRATNAQSRKKEERALAESEETTQNHSELWDVWGNWSTCSVTCGSGRQVRWRHCLAENCTKGLKRAQIKSCRLKDCHSKNILHWLGIKP